MSTRQARDDRVRGLPEEVGWQAAHGGVLRDQLTREHQRRLVDRCEAGSRWQVVSQNNAVIMAVLCGVIAMKLVGDALSGLTS